jgi:hypothetical protein
VCGCDSEIRRRVELLLEAGSHMGSFLKEPAWVPQPPLISQVADPRVVQARRAGKSVLRKVFCRVGKAELGSAQPTEPRSLASVGCTQPTGGKPSFSTGSQIRTCDRDGTFPGMARIVLSFSSFPFRHEYWKTGPDLAKPPGRGCVAKQSSP